MGLNGLTEKPIPSPHWITGGRGSSVPPKNPRPSVPGSRLVIPVLLISGCHQTVISESSTAARTAHTATASPCLFMRRFHACFGNASHMRLPGIPDMLRSSFRAWGIASSPQRRMPLFDCSLVEHVVIEPTDLSGSSPSFLLDMQVSNDH